MNVRLIFVELTVVIEIQIAEMFDRRKGMSRCLNFLEGFFEHTVYNHTW
jgi:hypothetical protein